MQAWVLRKLCATLGIIISCGFSKASEGIGYLFAVARMTSMLNMHAASYQTPSRVVATSAIM